MAEPSSKDLVLAVIGGTTPGEDLVIDCLLSDNHNFDSEVTEFPVESGATISDNIRNKPLVVTMDCLVSNTPIGLVATLRDENTVPADTAYAALLRVRDARKPVTIGTSLSTYRNMALQNLTIPRESGRGDELRFTVTWKQIETIVNRRDKRVAIVGAKSGGSKTVPPIIDDSRDSVFVHVPDYTWYDVEIGGWREKLLIASATTDSTGRRIPGVNDLFDNRPIDIPFALWSNEPVAQHTTTILRPRIKKLQGGVRRTVLHNKDPKNVLLLHRGQYQITRLINAAVRFQNA